MVGARGTEGGQSDATRSPARNSSTTSSSLKWPTIRWSVEASRRRCGAKAAAVRSSFLVGAAVLRSGNGGTERVLGAVRFDVAPAPRR